MKNILQKIKINNFTYFFIILCFLCGYIKNIFIIFSICLIHEMGHIFFIKLFNYKVLSISITPFGGYTYIEKKINSDINKDLLISIGGILIQLIFLLFLFIFKNNFNLITYNLYIKYNIILIIFNLIPIIPLDGNKIIHLLFEKFFSYHLSYRLNSIISFFFLILFIFMNYYLNLDNYFIISFLLYQFIIYIKNEKYLNKRFLLERYLYDLDYQRIDNHTKNIDDLKKNVLHFFKEDNKYIKEKDKIKDFLYHLEG